MFAPGVLLLPLVALLVAAASSARKPVVIDCDGVSDDVRAITLALQTPGVEVLAITTSSGSTNSAQAAINVERALRANNAHEVPVFKGADRPLLRTPIDFTFLKEFFGSDGLGDAPNAFSPVLQSDVAVAHERNVSAAAALLDIFGKRRDVTL
ncbi:Protein Y43F8C.13, partial [Aphelenchoides avenae]